MVERLQEFPSPVGPGENVLSQLLIISCLCAGEARYIGPVGHPDLTPHVIVVGIDSEQGDVEENIDNVRDSIRAAAGEDQSELSLV